MPETQQFSPEEKKEILREIEKKLASEAEYEELESIGRSERSMSRGRRGGRGGKGIGREHRRQAFRD